MENINIIIMFDNYKIYYERLVHGSSTIIKFTINLLNFIDDRSYYSIFNSKLIFDLQNIKYYKL
jgi:hypothetical protein